MGLTLGLLTSGREHRCCLLRSPAESEPGRSTRRNRMPLTGRFIGGSEERHGSDSGAGGYMKVVLVLVVALHFGASVLLFWPERCSRLGSFYLCRLPVRRAAWRIQWHLVVRLLTEYPTHSLSNDVREATVACTSKTMSSSTGRGSQVESDEVP